MKEKFKVGDRVYWKHGDNVFHKLRGVVTTPARTIPKRTYGPFYGVEWDIG